MKAAPLAPPKVRRKRLFNNEPKFDLRTHLYGVFGVDLTAVPGISVLIAHTILAEIVTCPPKTLLAIIEDSPAEMRRGVLKREEDAA